MDQSRIILHCAERDLPIDPQINATKIQTMTAERSTGIPLRRALHTKITAYAMSAIRRAAANEKLRRIGASGVKGSGRGSLKRATHEYFCQMGAVLSSSIVVA